MKRFKKSLAFLLIVALMVCALSYTVSAAIIFPDGDFGYTINPSTGNAIVYEYYGKGAEVVIPSEFNGRIVETIDENTFKGNSTISSVVIPESITTIKEYAFSNCTNLKSITIPESVTNFEPYVFAGCTSLESVVINADVSAIPNSTFYNCTSLSSVVLSDDITEIGNSAFYNCTSLKNFPSRNITNYGQKCFYGAGIESLSISENVEEISSYAFNNTPSLKSIVFFGDATNVADNALDTTNSDLMVYCKDNSSALQHAVDHIKNYTLIDGIVGDPDGNNKVTIFDVTTIQRHLANISQLDTIHQLYADTNGDGVVTINDATQIQRYLALIIDTI